MLKVHGIKSIGILKINFPLRCFIFGCIIIGQCREITFRFIMNIGFFKRPQLDKFKYKYGLKKCLICQLIIKLGPL